VRNQCKALIAGNTFPYYMPEVLCNTQCWCFTQREFLLLMPRGIHVSLGVTFTDQLELSAGRSKQQRRRGGRVVMTLTIAGKGCF